jgi:hypothetical protein
MKYSQVGGRQLLKFKGSVTLTSLTLELGTPTSIHINESSAVLPILGRTVAGGFQELKVTVLTLILCPLLTEILGTAFPENPMTLTSIQVNAGSIEGLLWADCAIAMVCTVHNSESDISFVRKAPTEKVLWEEFTGKKFLERVPSEKVP